MSGTKQPKPVPNSPDQPLSSFAAHPPPPPAGCRQASHGAKTIPRARCTSDGTTTHAHKRVLPVRRFPHRVPLRVDVLEGVAAVPVHVSVAVGGSSVGEEERHLLEKTPRPTKKMDEDIGKRGRALNTNIQYTEREARHGYRGMAAALGKGRKRKGTIGTTL